MSREQLRENTVNEGSPSAGSDAKMTRADSPDVHGWQPIETATKDGNEVDLWCVNISDGNGARFPAMFWDKDGGWQDWHSYLLETKWRPTHWMWPPEPPVLP